MIVRYQISEFSDGLTVVVRSKPTAPTRALIASIVGVAFFVGSQPTFGYWSILIASVAAFATFLSNLGGQAELRATKFEFLSKGNLGRRGAKTKQVVCTGDVRGLEFREANGRSGVYALTDKAAYCILPFLDYAQTMEVIRAIQIKFPGLAEHWQIETRAGEHFLTLGLGKAKRVE